jgi:hypothetical protein
MSKRQRKKEPRFPTGIPDLVRVSMEDPDHHSACGSGDHSHCFAIQGTVAPSHVISEPDINTQLATIAAERGDSFFILNLEHFFHYRGDADIGGTPKGTPGAVHGRDCLHWCFAPGIFDAITRETLALIHPLLLL